MGKKYTNHGLKWRAYDICIARARVTRFWFVYCEATLHEVGKIYVQCTQNPSKIHYPKIFVKIHMHQFVKSVSLQNVLTQFKTVPECIYNHITAMGVSAMFSAGQH